MKRHTCLTSRQIKVLQLRKRGFTQEKVAKLIGTSRENVSIIERNAYRAVQVAQSTIEAFESLNEDGIIMIPTRTSIYDIPHLIFTRADFLGVKLKNDAHTIFSLVTTKGKIRNHCLISPIAVEIKSDGRISVH
jgi:hypothetical protein